MAIIEQYAVDTETRDKAPPPFLGLIEYLPRRQLAKQLGQLVRGRAYSEMTLIQWERDGKGPPATRVGRDVVYHIPTVEKWLRSREKAAKTVP